MLLSNAIDVANRLAAVRRADLMRIVMSSTAQKGAGAYPTGSRLLEVTRDKLVEVASEQGICLRQSYPRCGAGLSVRQNVMRIHASSNGCGGHRATHHTGPGEVIRDMNLN